MRQLLCACRYFAYSDLHEGSLPASCRDRFEVLRPVDPTTTLSSSSTPQRQFIKGKLVESLFHHSDPLSTLLIKGSEEVDDSKAAFSAALVLQMWFRLGYSVPILLTKSF